MVEFMVKNYITHDAVQKFHQSESCRNQSAPFSSAPSHDVIKLVSSCSQNT